MCIRDRMYLLREPKLAVAFSGGCDSALLLAAAKLAGCEVHAYPVSYTHLDVYKRQA